MITLEEAVCVAKSYLKKEHMILDKCNDLEDYWIFDGHLDENPNEVMMDAPLVKIEKKTGEVEYYFLPGIDVELFHEYFEAPEIDISEYL